MKTPPKVNRRENAQSRPGLSSTMKQGGTKRDGDAAKAGNTRSLMDNGGNSQTAKSPEGKLASIMHQ